MPKAARRTSGPKEPSTNTSTSTSTNTNPTSASTPYPPASARKAHPPRPRTSLSPSSTPLFLSIPLPSSNSDSDPETQTVPIYDTCDEIRAKIHAFLASQHPVPGFDKPYTKKMFLEQIGGLNANSLRRFLDARGEGRGSENGVYYGAYCFFEKLRLFTDAPKSEARLANEQNHPTGLPRHDPARSHAGEPMLAPPSPSSSHSSVPASNNGGRKWRRQPPSIIVGPGENPSDFLTEEEKALWYFPCEAVGHKHGHGLGRRGKGVGVARKK